MDTVVVVLTYVGTVFIAMEFVRKVTNLQALMGMVVGWPVSPYLSEHGLEKIKTDYQRHKVIIPLRVFTSVVLATLSIPFSILFYIIWFFILLLNSLHNWVNRTYSNGKIKFDYLMRMITGLSLFAHKIRNYEGYKDIKEDQVIEEIKKYDIPIIPIIGIILISLALILYLV